MSSHYSSEADLFFSFLEQRRQQGGLNQSVESLLSEFRNVVGSQGIEIQDSDILAIEEGLRDIESGNSFSEEDIKAETAQMFSFLKDAK